MTAREDLYAAALRHVAAGRPVFPCNRRKKPRTEHGFLDATTDAEQTRRWFANGSDSVLAIPTGRVSRLVDVDVDGDEGSESLWNLEARFGQLPRTASVKTPRGGQHYWFRLPGVEVPTTAGKFAVGVDIRGDGGYAVIPPSPGYEIDEEAPPAELPPWLLALVTRHDGNGHKHATPTSVWVALLANGVAEGRRNDSLARLVGYLLCRDVDVDVVVELVHAVNETRFRPPLDRREVDATINSILAAELRQRAGQSPTRRRHD